uniref:Uncharacterized protein n=1 Tax=Anguilla anguilla TaxID=7936 RepID=A0A0E9XCN6_ANGAN
MAMMVVPILSPFELQSLTVPPCIFVTLLFL